jgi:hypothetical protein
MYYTSLIYVHFKKSAVIIEHESERRGGAEILRTWQLSYLDFLIYGGQSALLLFPPFFCSFVHFFGLSQDFSNIFLLGYNLSSQCINSKEWVTSRKI